MNTSDLHFEHHSFPPFSLHNCTQTLRYAHGIRAPKRTLNGNLVLIDTLMPHEKFSSTIVGKFKQDPLLGQLAPGDFLKVHCLQRLWQRLPCLSDQDSSPSTLQSCSLLRPPVPESIQLTDGNDGLYSFEWRENKVWYDPSIPTPLFVSYRPILEMILTAFKSTYTEVDLETSWSLDLEEV